MSVRTDVVNLNVNINGDSAKNELNQLRKRSADLSAEMKGLNQRTVEGRQRYQELQRELTSTNARMAELRGQIGLTSLSQKELTAELRRLQALKNITTPQTKEFRELQTQIDAVNNRLQQVRTGMFGFQSFLGNIKDEIKQFGVLAASYLGFEFITGQISNIISGQAKISDKLADLRRVAGLTDAQVKELYKSLRALDTRTGVQTLLDLAIIAGKLGVEKDKIAGFTAALDELQVALGDELGDADTIAEQLGKIINVYDNGGKITGDRALQIGNAIVDLANKGVASGRFIVDFTQRLGGIAKTAKIGLDETVGLAAGLEELGLKSESSSTAVIKVISAIGTDVPKYAAIAGKSVEDFSKTLGSRPVEALIQVSQGLVKGKAGFEDIASAFKNAGEDGARIISTLGVIGDKADFMRGKIQNAGEALQGTGAITDAFNLKNQTFGATIDRISKAFAGFVNSKAVTDLMVSLANATERLLKSLPKVIAFVKDNALALTLYAAALINTTTLGAKLIGFFTSAVTWIARMITGMKGLTLAQIANDIASKAQIITTTSLSLVQALLAGNIAKARQEWQLLTVALGANPLTALLVVVGTLLLAMNALIGKTRELTAAERVQAELANKVADATTDQVVKVQLYTNALNNHNLSQDARKRALEELIRLNPQYLNGLTLENAATAQGKKIIDDYIASLQKKAREEAAYALKVENLKEKVSLEQEFAKAGKELDAISKSIPKSIFYAFAGDYFNSGPVAKYEELKKKVQQNAEDAKEIDKIVQQSVNESLAPTPDDKEKGGTAGETIDALKKKLNDKLETLKAAYGQLLAVNEKGKADNLKQQKELQDQLDRLDGKTPKGDKANERKEKAAEERLAKVKAQIEALRNELDAAAENADAAAIARIQNKYAKYIKEAAGFAAEIAELDKLQAQELAQLVEKQFAARSDKEYEDSLQKLKNYYENERQLAGQAYAAGTISKQAYTNKLKDLDHDEATGRAQISEDYAATSKKAATEAEKNKTEAVKKGIEDRENLEKQSAQDAVNRAQREVATSPKGSNSEFLAKQRLLKAQFDLDTQYLDKKNDLYQQKQAQLNRSLDDLNKEHNRETIDKVQNTFQGIADIMSAYYDLQNQRDQQELSEEKSSNDQKKASYKEQLDARKISKYDYDKAIAQLDADLDKKQAEINAKAAKRQKAASLMNAIVNTAAGVARAFSDYAWPYSLIPAAIIAGLGAIQIEKISEEKVPTGRKGLVVQGPSHEDQGIDMIERKSGRRIANIEGGEPVMVLSKNTYGNNKPIIDELIYNSQHRNGARISAQWYSNNKPKTINSDRLVPMMRAGGIIDTKAQITTNGSNATTTIDMNATNTLLQQLIAEQQITRQQMAATQKELRAYVVYQDITDSGDLLNKAKSVAGVNQNS